MMRLVQTYCVFVQFVPTFAGSFLKHFDSICRPAKFSFKHTYSLLLIAAMSLLQIGLSAQCNELLCNQNVEVKLDANCIANANIYYMVSNYWSCSGPGTMAYYDQWGNPIPNNVVTGSYLGQTLNVHVTSDWYNKSCWGSIKVVDKRKPEIQISHVTLNCTEDTGSGTTGHPVVTDNCSSNILVTHADSTIDFGCGYTGFAGYFAPSNWDVCLVNNGDGGVDVTGAPDNILVEGANNSPLSASPKYVTKYKIAIPTEGFVSFDWSSFGGPSFDSEGFYLTINNWCIQITNDSVQSGSYTTGLLQPGDILSFEQVSDGNAAAVHTIVSNFHFHTLAWKVIHRSWSATDQSGNTRQFTQVITQKRAVLSQIQFPPHRDGLAAPMLACGDMADIALTGKPFVDEDGNLNTTHDQFALDNGECAFQVGFQDQTIATCAGSELVLRKWVILDNCSSHFLEHTQLIKLFDITPPVVNCPPPQTVSTANFGCFSNLNLPQATAFDDCSPTVTVTPTWQFGAGFGPFGNISPGTYPVTYQAVDDCGNLNTCTTSVHVMDAVGPTVVCDAQTVAAINSNGTAVVYADAVDDGSYDWCCVESFLIKKQGAPDNGYGPSLTFQCTDLGPIMVTLKVTDCAGNSNTCNVAVQVQDNEYPVILPPADLTVDCTTDLTDLSVFGQANVFDNCSFLLDAFYEESFTGCGEGALIRTWTATDPSGNSASAQQRITLANLAPWNLNGNNIVWPGDYTTQGCQISLEPFDLPQPFAGPTLLGQNGCESVAVSHTDQYFWIAEPSCYSVHRKWKIIDWCQFVPNSGSNAGVWEHVQVIEVLDVEPPQFVNPPDQITVQGTNGCIGNVVLPLPQVADCSNHVTVVASGQLGSGFSFQNVPAGTYTMTYHAEDGCGNASTHTFTVSVGDNQAPTAVCLNGLTVGLGSGAQSTVLASTFNSGSFDNCSQNLRFSFTQNPADDSAIFNCSDLGSNVLQIYVFDDGGNMATCQTNLMVLDNQSVCPQPDIVIGGLVHDPAGNMVAQAQVSLAGAQMPVQSTGMNGAYQFEGLPSGNNFTITPNKSTHYLNGVTAYDLFKINSHILGVEIFQEPWQYIAADANGNQSVTTFDIVAIQNLILHNTTQFPNGVPSWQFVADDHVFSNPYNPWPYPKQITMNNLTEDYMDADFLAIKVGDVTGNADPTMFGEGFEERSGGLFPIKTKKQTVAAGEMVEVDFEMPKTVSAYQFTLKFDPAKLAFLEMKSGNPSLGTAYLERGELTVIWYGKGEPAFILAFAAKQAVTLEHALEITSDKTKAVAWDGLENALDVRLEFAADFSQTAVSQDVVLLGNRPNPFSTETAILFQLAEPGNVRFNFRDTAGRLLFFQKGYFEMGHQSLKINGSDLKTTGLVFYEMLLENGTRQVGRMVVE